jgi:hypothetical protein
VPLIGPPERAPAVAPSGAFLATGYRPCSPTKDVLRVECTKCDRRGRYHVHKLIEKYGRKGNMMKWREMLNADCPKRDAD